MSHLALVTGASSGIGRHIAIALAERGYDIIGVGASDRIDRLAADLPGVGATAVRADLRSREGADAVWRAVASTGRELDVAVLNAGVSLGGAFIDTDIEDDLDLVGVNVVSQLVLAKHVARHMASNGRGHILLTSSMSALTPTPYATTYGPSKAFVFSFAEGLREELREHGVGVTALLPAATQTDFHRRAGMQNTALGSSAGKFAPRQIAELGLEGLFRGDDHVIGGDDAVVAAALRDRAMPEEEKARRYAAHARP